MALTKVTGSVIKDSVSLSGNVSVGGTLTYQDVTNVDALGIGTFRTGIKVLAGQVDIGSNIKLGNAGVITATSFSGALSGTTGSFSGQVNIGSNIKLGTAGVVTATSFVGSGANLTSIPAGNLTGTVADARISTLTASKLTGALPAISGANLTGVLKNVVEDSSPQLGGDLQSNGNDIRFADNDKARFGASADIEIYHDNSNSRSYVLSNTDNELRILQAGNAGMLIQNQNSYNIEIKTNAEDAIKCVANGAVELFYNGNARLYTTNTGISINSNTLIASAGADNVQIGDGTSNAGITLYSNSSNNGAIYFGDGTGGTNPYSGFLQYYHSTNSIALGTLGGEKVVINSVGRGFHRCTTRFNREAYTKGGTIHGGGAATGANSINPGAFVFLNDTPVRGTNTRYSFWIQSGDEYPNASNYIDLDIGNSFMYRVLIKGSHSSVTAEMAMFLIYGLANSSGNLPPRIQEVSTNTPSFNGDSGGSGSFANNSGQFNCRVMGYGTSGGTRGSLSTYNTTLRIEYTGNNNQGLLAFIERWDTGT